MCSGGAGVRLQGEEGAHNVRAGPGDARPGRAVHAAVAVGREAEGAERDQEPVPASRARLLHGHHHGGDVGPRAPAAQALLQLALRHQEQGRREGGRQALLRARLRRRLLQGHRLGTLVLSAYLSDHLHYSYTPEHAWCSSMSSYTCGLDQVQ